ALVVTLRYSTPKAQRLTSRVRNANVAWIDQCHAWSCAPAPAAAVAMAMSIENNAGGKVDRFSSRVVLCHGASGSRYAKVTSLTQRPVPRKYVKMMQCTS